MDSRRVERAEEFGTPTSMGWGPAECGSREDTRQRIPLSISRRCSVPISLRRGGLKRGDTQSIPAMQLLNPSPDDEPHNRPAITRMRTTAGRDGCRTEAKVGHHTARSADARCPMTCFSIAGCARTCIGSGGYKARMRGSSGRFKPEELHWPVLARRRRYTGASATQARGSPPAGHERDMGNAQTGTRYADLCGNLPSTPPPPCKKRMLRTRRVLELWMIELERRYSAQWGRWMGAGIAIRESGLAGEKHICVRHRRCTRELVCDGGGSVHWMVKTDVQRGRRFGWDIEMPGGLAAPTWFWTAPPWRRAAAQARRGAVARRRQPGAQAHGHGAHLPAQARRGGRVPQFQDMQLKIEQTLSELSAAKRKNSAACPWACLFFVRSLAGLSPLRQSSSMPETEVRAV
ncbi:hypothetical protein FB451DRAFT_1178235 [Mycena latifolia]|nr:hypothetical protein FB451DRAFT_1178235 [Mycena latifolia]